MEKGEMRRSCFLWRTARSDAGILALVLLLMAELVIFYLTLQNWVY